MMTPHVVSRKSLINHHWLSSKSPFTLDTHIYIIMSYSSLDSPTEILQQAASPLPYTPPPSTQLLHKQKLQWRENAKELMDATIDKWTYPSVLLTALEDIRNSAKIAAQLAKIWALAQSDPMQRDSTNVKYHMERLWHHFENANRPWQHICRQHGNTPST